MKVSELTGKQLDYWVAKAEGMQITLRNGHPATSRRFDPEYHSNETDWKYMKSYFYFQPSTEWSEGGPIIERERIGLDTWQNVWAAQYTFPVRHPTDLKRDPSHYRMNGETPLVAAMRAYVASKYGDEVPEERFAK